MTDTTPYTASTPIQRPSPSVRLVQRSRRDATAALPAALHSEWVKVSSLRSNVWIVATTPVIGVALSWIMATFVKVDPVDDLPFTVAETFIFSTWLTAVLASILGTLAFTADVQHGTMAAAIAAQPARWVLVVPKATIAAGVGLVMGFLGMIGGLAGAILGGLPKGDTSAMVSTALWGLLLTTLAPVLGLGVGMIVRHSAAAVSSLLVWAFVLENIAHALLPVSAARYLPFSVATKLLDMDAPSDTPETIAAALTSTQNALIFGGYSFALLALGTALFVRRDVD